MTISGYNKSNRFTRLLNHLFIYQINYIDTTNLSKDVPQMYQRVGICQSLYN